MKKTQSDPQVEKLQEEINQLKDQHARAVADYHNLEKRMSVQQQQFVRMATARVMSRFLEVLDNLQRAVGHISDPGLEMVIKDFKRHLNEEGVKELDIQGQAFDANQMECVDLVPGKKDTVIFVVTPGYTFEDHLLRPAKVRVGNGKDSEAAATASA